MITIEDGCLSAQFTPIGAAMMALHHRAVPQSLVLGFEDEAQYARNPAYLGAVCGRVSNRIGGASFDLNGRSYPLTANEGHNQLHGAHQAGAIAYGTSSSNLKTRFALACGIRTASKVFPAMSTCTCTIA